jgi:hypothetical protein
LFCEEKNIVAKSKEVKTGSDLTESSQEGLGLRNGCVANDEDNFCMYGAQNAKKLSFRLC